MKELHNIQMNDSFDNPAVQDPIKEELHSLLEQENLKLKQRAKETWLQFGDRNTKYFHICAIQKKRRSQILMIKDIDDRLCTTHAELEVAFVSYYTKLFTARKDLDMEDCLGALDRKVSLEMN